MLNTGTAPEHHTVVLTTAIENTHLYVVINSSIKHEISMAMVQLYILVWLLHSWITCVTAGGEERT